MKFKQFSCVLGLAIGIIASNIPKASALDFSFSFSNQDGNVDGTVTGTIKGLKDNTTSAATEVDLTSYPAGLGTNPNPSGNVVYTSSGGGWDPNASGSFTVTNGLITDYQFYASSKPSELVLDSSEQISSLVLNYNPNITYNYVHNSSLNSVVFTSASATVPFEFSPSEGILLGVPLFIGLRILKRKRAMKMLAVDQVN